MTDEKPAAKKRHGTENRQRQKVTPVRWEMSEFNKVAAKAGTGVLVITHYQRILNYIKPQHVHIMLDGQIVESGGAELALHLEEAGYDWLREREEEK